MGIDNIKKPLPTVKRTGDNFRIIVPSKIDLGQSDNFNLRVKKENIPNLPLKFNINNEETFLNLKFDDDYHYLYNNVISELDNQILIFICQFRFVQKLHLIKEFNDVNSHKLTKSLNRLMNCHLIDKWEYDRIEPSSDENSKIGEAFFTKTAGDLYLAINRLYKPSHMTRWDKKIENYSIHDLISYWKICDVYQYMKLNKDYVKYTPEYVCKEQTYYIVVKAQDGTEKRVKRVAKETRLNGSILLKTVQNSKNSYYSINLFPIVTEDNIKYLKRPLNHWALYKKEWDESDKTTLESQPKRFLAVVCDNFDVIKQIVKEYDLKSLKVDLLFINLSDLSDNDIRKGIYILDKRSPEVEFLLFKFDMIDQE